MHNHDIINEIIYTARDKIRVGECRPLLSLFIVWKMSGSLDYHDRWDSDRTLICLAHCPVNKILNQPIDFSRLREVDEVLRLFERDNIISFRRT